MKKRIVSVVIMACMVAAFFSGMSGVPAASVSLDELQAKIYEGLEVYYTYGLEQTARNLKNKIGLAQMLVNDSSTSQTKINDAYTSLNTAIEEFVPINNISRSEINGIEYWTDEQVADMEIKGATVSLNSVTKAEIATKSLMFQMNAKEAFFSNSHTLDGVYSPFGQDMNDAAGISFWIAANDYSLVNTIDLYVGKKDLDTDDVLSVYDIPVSKEGYVYVSWQDFYPEYNNFDAKLDLCGGMNYLAFSIHGNENATVYISDIHAFVAGVEDNKQEYQEVLIGSLDEVKRDGVYKIVDVDTGLYLTFGPLISETQFRSDSRTKFTESNQKFTLENNFGEDVTQQWQVYKMMKHDKYTITNQGTAAGMTVDYFGDLQLEMHSDLENQNQMWDVLCENGHFKFKNGNLYIGIVGGTPSLTTSADTEWMLYECIREEWVQVWGDEFNDGTLDRTKWNTDEGHTRGDTEPEYFRDSPDNYWFEDGSLVIRSAVEEYKGYHATSASFDTQGIYALTYGKIEVRCKLTEEANYWPAFWSMGQYGNWPQNGELDMMEFDSDGGAGYYNYAPYFTNHWWNFDKHKNIAKGTTVYTEGHEWLSKGYHTFTCEWDATQARSYLDGQLVMSLLFNTDEQRWSFGDNPHYFIMYVSMKGDGGCAVKPGTPDEALTYFDYVRIYKRSSEVAKVPAYNDKIIKGENITPGNTGWSMCLDKSPDGKYIASTSRFNVSIIDSATDKVIKTLADPSDEISVVKFSADSSRLLVADRLGSIRIYETNTWANLLTTRCSGLYIQSAVFSPDNRYFFIGGRNSSDQVLATDSSMYIYRFSAIDPNDKGTRVLTNSNARNLKLSPDGTKLAAACADGSVYIFENLSSGITQYVKFDEHERCVRGLDWSPDGKSLVSADEVGKINVYDVERKILRYTAQNPSTASITSASYSPDGTKILVNGSADNARLFDAENGRQISVFGGFSQGVATAQWSKDGSKILLMSRDGYGRIFDSDCNYLVTLDGRTQLTPAGEQKATYCIHESVFNDDATKVYGITYHAIANTYRWNITYNETDNTALKEALASVAEVDSEACDKTSYSNLMNTVDKYKRIIRFYGASQSDIDSAALAVNAAVKLALNGGITGLEPWNTTDTSNMTVTKCKSTMNIEDVNGKAINTLRVYTTGKAWEMNNINTKDGSVIKNPYGNDLRFYLGLTITAYANKDVTDSEIYIGYTGNPENTIYKYKIGALSLTPTEYKIPFASFERVSGDEKLDLSKLEIFGVTGTGKASTAVYYCNFDAYQDQSGMPIVIGVEDGKEYDLDKEDAPSATWNVGEATLDGVTYSADTPITTIGEHTLIVTNGDKTTTITFKVIDTAVAPIVIGIVDNAEYDLHDVDAPSAAWDVGEATLDGEAYIADTPIETVGNHTLTVVNGRKTTEIKFVVKNTSVAPTVIGVEEGAEYDLLSEKVVITWDIGVALLNGEPVVSGVEITEPGKYTLKVTDGTETKEVSFTVVYTKPLLPGDINSDDKISIVDAMMALRISASIIDDPTNGNADITKDGSVTIEDALMILRICLGMIDAK